MKLKKSALIFFLNLFILGLSAQELAYKNYEWESNPQLHQLSEEEKESNYTTLKETTILEYVYESSGELVMYETKHVIIHFNNEKGIEQMNKIYIPYSRILEEIDLKARTITSDGKVILLSRSSVKKVDNIEDAGSFLIFAMEGVDKGGEIEYLYTNKKTPNLNGIWTVQTDKIVKNVSIDVYSPENLIFEGKGYNGFPEFTKDTTTTERNHIYAKKDKVEALYDEKYAAINASRMRFEIQLAYNTARNNSRLYTWDNMGLDIYKAFYSFTKQELKAVSKLISTLGIKKLETDDQKIRAFETYMKTNINNKATGEKLSLDQVLARKNGSENDLQRIYMAAANVLKIPFETVITLDRMNRKFDEDFPSWNSLQEFLIYFPTLDKYLSATNYLSRLGFPPPELVGNKGLFISETEIGKIKTAITKVKELEAPDIANSYNNINTTVKFEPEVFTPKIKMKHEFMGYSAYYTQTTLPYLDDKQKKEFLDEMAKFIGEETIVKSAELTGENQEDILVKPLIINCEVEAPQLVQSTNDKFLFRVGGLIGPQEEMYQEKERQTDAEIHYTHSYTRILEINIPQGYRVANLDDLNINKKCYLNRKPVASFISKYIFEKGVLRIKVTEEYNTLVYPKDIFEDYRVVINAAADFNKITLIIEKR